MNLKILLSLFIFLFFSMLVSAQIVDTTNQISRDCNKYDQSTLNISFENDSIILYGSVLMNCFPNNYLFREIDNNFIKLTAADMPAWACLCNFDYRTSIYNTGEDSINIILGYLHLHNENYELYFDTTVYNSYNSINNLPLDESLLVAPNPVSDWISISNNKQAIHTIELYSLSGEQVYYRSINNTIEINLDIGDLPKGAYVLKAVTDKRNYFKKIIKQ